MGSKIDGKYAFLIKMAGRIENELGVVFPGGTEQDLKDFVFEYIDLIDYERPSGKTHWKKKRKDKPKKKTAYKPLKGADFKPGGQILKRN